MQTFNFNVDVNPETDYSVRALRSDLNEEFHAHEQAEGYNPVSRKWRISRTDNLPALKPLREFIRAHRGYKSFLWVTPEGETVKVKAETLSLSTSGPFRGNISITLEEVFSPAN